MRYDISNIGEEIRKIQKENEKTQADFADNIGINIGTLSRWIRGLQFPNLMGILTICDVYDVKITDLIKPIPTPYKPKGRRYDQP